MKQSASSSMIRGENSNYLSIDLINEILSRLPAKSIIRFRCVSKLWKTMLHHTYFTDLFLTKSSARPRLLFATQKDDVWHFYTSLLPLPHPYEQSLSLEVAANFHTKLYECQNISTSPPWHLSFSTSYASRLIYIPGMYMSKHDYDAVPVICNPSTGQYAILPEPRGNSLSLSDSFLGFDPIDKKYKVLCKEERCACHYQILTIGTRKMRWRKIQCPLTHYPYGENICINGVLYYFARKPDETFVIVCFDFRSEKFKFIEPDSFCKTSYKLSIYQSLMNYKGKLGGIGWEKYVDAGGKPTVELRIWVLEDVEKREWSKYVCSLPEDKVFEDCFIHVATVTATGDIVLWMVHDYKKPFYFFYLNLKRKTLQTVEIFQGVGEYHELFEKFTRVEVIVDYVENLNFIT